MNDQTVIKNGELREITQRLVRLETQFDERWKSHDTRSIEVWGEIKDKLNILFSKMDELRNKDTGELKESRDYTNRIVAWAIGIPVTISMLISICWVMLKQ